MWALLGNIIAWPLAFVLAGKWLDNFAYKMPIRWYTFMLAAALAIIIALLTVSYQAIRASKANPVDALKYE